MLSLKTFLVKEQISFLRLSDTYDIFDPSSGQKVGDAKETLHIALKLLRLLIDKQFFPTTITIADTTGKPLFSLKKSPQFLRAKVTVLDSSGTNIGYFKSKLISIGGGFHVYDVRDNKIAEVKGDWIGWNFKFLDQNSVEIGTVTKKWAGIGKELFTSADNYVISLTETSPSAAKKMLLVAAGLAIDLVYKENR